MKKTFRLRELDCAHCAAKMEEAVRRIDGVEEASVSFMAQKLTLSAPDERFEDVLRQAVAACKRIEPDCTIVL